MGRNVGLSLAAAVMPVGREFAQMGIAPADQVHLTRAFRSALHGFVMLEQGGGFGMPESVDESFRRVVDLLVHAVQAALAEPVRGRGNARSAGTG